MTDKQQLAISLHQSGDLLSAEQHYLELLHVHDDKKIRYLLGLLYTQKKQYTFAITQFENTQISNKKNADLHNALAICYQKTGLFSLAESTINIACQLAPNNKNYANRKSKILISAHKLHESMNNAMQCINKHPDFFPAYQSYATACNLLYRPDNGLRLIKRAYQRFPNSQEIRFSLAEAYCHVGNNVKAKALLLELINENFKPAQCINNLGMIEKDTGDIKTAIQLYEHALTLSTEDSQEKKIITWNLGIAQLLKSENIVGWKKYDARLEFYRLNPVLEKMQIWQGEDLNGKNIIILAEQGLGDQILFSSAFNWVINRAKKTYIECDSKLVDMFKKKFPSAYIQSQELSAPIICDYKIYSGSIFQYIEGDHSTATSAPQQQKNKKVHVGFSWRGATKYKDMKKRSTHLRQWFTIFNNSQYHFHCLQHEVSIREKELLKPYNIHFPQLSSDSIEPLADYIANLDLVISVTNTNIHIAGALNIETWCITPHNPDWHWGLEGEGCEWYPSVKILRKKNEKWDSVFLSIDKMLKND